MEKNVRPPIVTYRIGLYKPRRRIVSVEIRVRFGRFWGTRKRTVVEIFETDFHFAKINFLQAVEIVILMFDSILRLCLLFLILLCLKLFSDIRSAFKLEDVTSLESPSTAGWMKNYLTKNTSRGLNSFEISLHIFS